LSYSKAAVISAFLTCALFAQVVESDPIKGRDVHVSMNRGILNGPLLKRQVPEPKDPRETLKLAIEDMIAEYGLDYPRGKEFLERLAAIASTEDSAFETLKREALLANPIIDFEEILLIKRKGTGMLNNWKGNSGMRGGGKGVDSELMRLDIRTGDLSSVYKPEEANYVGQFDLHYDADRVLFSSPSTNGGWGIFQISIDPVSGSMKANSLKQITPDMGSDIDNYDGVYLPDDQIIFVSSAAYSGVPCVGGRDYVGNLYLMTADGSDIRRLTFEQDNDWNPVLMDNGRVMYLRWEYTDSAHYFSRVMMYMNQDGTDQKGFYGSNSYWPNAMFFPRPVPGSSSKFVAIVGSHHGSRRSGALVLFDTSKGRHEASGAVQVIGESGQPVEPVVLDNLAQAYSPHHLTPYPLSDKYFLTSINLDGWKIALVDVFDNVLILKDVPGMALLEPVPFKPRPKPPVMASRVRPGAKDATIWISDIHFGPGLREIPKGTAKSLRIYAYDYSPRRKGGHYAMGMESGWDARMLLGTVPFEDDGSVMVKVPANTPLSLQPLDKDGKALQLMRSWLVAMPGETLSCIGCHENPDAAPPPRMTVAARKPPVEINPWYGKTRGFSFTREVQPVIDRYCIGCHSSAVTNKPTLNALIKSSKGRVGTGPNTGKRFSEAGIPDLSTPRAAHNNLHPYVRRNGPEGDYHLLTPLEFHADTSPLVQMLQKGHHNVKMDGEAWDRIITWIDLNVPFHGTWTEAGADKNILARRLELQKQYANVDFNPETVVNPYSQTNAFVEPELQPAPAPPHPIAEWPFDKDSAIKRQGASDPIRLDLGDDIVLTFNKIPGGTFLMGSNEETPVERPVNRVTISKSFWMGTTEVTLEQYRQFDPDYLNGVYDMHYKDQVKRGYYMNNMKFPVIRVSWEMANNYCKWLSSKSGKTVRLPTEAEWEWACRAGSAKPFSYGDLDTDFSTYANLADITKKELAVSGVNPRPIRNPNPSVDYELKDPRFNDKTLHLAPVATYQPNVWGLYDMHGNVAEWTASPYAPYPSKESQDISDPRKVIRGGSWNDRPHRSTSSYRLGFPKWQRVYNVGFRVVIE
jgi:formylglycine-generating enzyme required for sulfatase activity